MKPQIILCAIATIFFFSAYTKANDYKLVCYFASWSIYRNHSGTFTVNEIDPDLCTHINFAFVELFDNGSLNIIDPWESNDPGNGGHYEEFRHLQLLKSQNPNLKILVSLGGWNANSRNFSIIAADPEKRKRLGNDLLQLVNKYNFDGVDVDWEYPTLRDGASKHDKKNYVLLLKDFKEILQPYGKLLTAAVAGAVEKIEAAYDPEIFKYLDFLNLMTYDYHGAFDNFIGHISPLHASSFDYKHPRNETYNVATAVEYWLYKFGEPKKLNLGIATYGRTFTLADVNKRNLYDPVAGPGNPGVFTGLKGTLGFNDICDYCLTDSATDFYWDDEQKVPHLVYDTDQWVGYENETSVEEKVKFALSKGLGGIMLWTLDEDDFSGTCGRGRYPLTTAVKKTIAKYKDYYN